jgi:hypothetical protein
MDIEEETEDSQYSNNGDAQFARMDASYIEEAPSRHPSFNNKESQSFLPSIHSSSTVRSQQKGGKDVFHIIGEDEEVGIDNEDESEDDRLLREAIQQIQEEDKRNNTHDNTQRSSGMSSSSGGSGISRGGGSSETATHSSSSSSSSRRTKPLYAEDMRVQINRNNIWTVGRVIRGGVRLDGCYDVETEPSKGRPTEMCRRVAESSLRPYVPLADVDSDDERLTVRFGPYSFGLDLQL